MNAHKMYIRLFSFHSTSKTKLISIQRIFFSIITSKVLFLKGVGTVNLHPVVTENRNTRRAPQQSVHWVILCAVRGLEAPSRDIKLLSVHFRVFSTSKLRFSNAAALVIEMKTRRNGCCQTCDVWPVSRVPHHMAASTQLYHKIILNIWFLEKQRWS